MTKYRWATDIHLDHIQDRQYMIKFIESMTGSDPDVKGLFITGDISNGDRIDEHLRLLDAISPVPVYFILGNHDFYGSSISGVRAMVFKTANESKHLRYMTALEPIVLSQDTVLVGHDGWYDFGYGQARPIRFLMSDWKLISEYAMTVNREYGRHVLDDERIITKSYAFALQGAEHIKKMINKTTQKNVVILTHVPPFDTAAKHLGKPSDPEALPVFSCRVIGHTLLEIASQNPDRNFTVYCGHTHDQFNEMITPNLRCVVGFADYGKPLFNDIEIE